MNLLQSLPKENKKKRKRLAKEPSSSTPLNPLKNDDNLHESPKKKRRGNENLNNSTFPSPIVHQTSFSETLEMPSTQKKKRKRKKNKKRRESESSQSSMVEAKDAAETIVFKHIDDSIDKLDATPPMGTPSPKKKKKTKQNVDETIDVNNMTVPPMPDDKNIKSEKQEKDDMDIELLKEALKEASPTKKSYNVQMKSLDYEKLGNSFGISADEFQSRLKMLIDRTPKVKSLQQVIEETLELIPFKRNTSSSFAKFIRENKKEIKEGIEKGLGTNEFAVASALWKNLDDEQRAKYKSTTTGKEFGKSPFSLFYETLKCKKSSITPKEGREKWKTLKTEKKIKYIERSMEMIVAHTKELEEKGEGGGGDVYSNNHGVRCPSKEEVLIYLRYLKFPELPSKVPALMYFKEKRKKNPLTSSNFLLDALKVFRALSDTEQNLWKKKFEEAWRKYEADVGKWKKRQSELTLSFLTFFKIPENQKAVKAGNRKLTKMKNKLEKIEMPFGNIKFELEPPLPPLNAVQLYVKELQKKSDEKISFVDAKSQLSALDKDTKELIKSKAENIRSSYINGLLAYLEDMPSDKRRLFLGLRREKYLKILKTDIFEDKYPNKDFPVYVRQAESKSEIKLGIDYGLDDDVLTTAITPSKVTERKKNVKGKVSAKAKISPVKPSQIYEQTDQSSEESDESSSEDEGQSSSFKKTISPKTIPQMKNPNNPKTIAQMKKPNNPKAIPQKQVKIDSDSESDDPGEFDSWMERMDSNIKNDDDEEEDSD